MPPCSWTASSVGVHRDLAAERAGHGDRDRCVGVVGGERRGGVPGGRVGLLDLGVQVGEPVLERLEATDDPAELPALLEVARSSSRAPTGRRRPARRRAARRPSAGRRRWLRRRPRTPASARRRRGSPRRAGGSCRASETGVTVAPRTAYSASPSGSRSTSAGSPTVVRARPVCARSGGPAVRRSARRTRATAGSSSSPSATSTVVATTLEVRNGEGAAARPISSSTAAASRAVAPAPPSDSGTSRPGRPSSTNADHSGRGHLVGAVVEPVEPVGGGVLVQHLAHRGAQVELDVVGEQVDVRGSGHGHRGRSFHGTSLSTRCSVGRPRIRSATTLRSTSEVPPSIELPLARR